MYGLTIQLRGMIILMILFLFLKTLMMGQEINVMLRPNHDHRVCHITTGTLTTATYITFLANQSDLRKH